MRYETDGISVIIPSYNRAHTLPRALDSVFAQTIPADEVIIIDDGSTDNTAQLIAEEYPQARYVHQDQAGVSAARNTGISIAQYEWLAFLDSDDAWQTDKLARQKQFLTNQTHISHCNEIWVRNGKRVNPMQKHTKRGGWIYQHCLPLCAISPSAVLIHERIFEEVGLFDESLPACEDYDLWLRICARYPVDYLNEPLVIKYGGHEDQLSKKYWGMDRFRIYSLEKILKQNVLNTDDEIATLGILLKKLEIYCKGAKKRNKLDELDRYTQKYERFANQLNSLAISS